MENNIRTEFEKYMDNEISDWEIKLDDETKEETKDFDSMNLTELKEYAKAQGVKGYSKMKKDELLAELKK